LKAEKQTAIRNSLSETAQNTSESSVDMQEESWTPCQLALFYPLQVFNNKKNVYGLRFDVFYGVNKTISGLDIGMVNEADSMYGIQIGVLYNCLHKSMEGIQAGIVNSVDGDLFFFQMALWNNTVNGGMTGIQTALNKNTVGHDAKGIMTSFTENCVTGSMNGIMTAFFSNNVDGNMHGVQTALINNINGSMNGLQFGMQNFVTGSMYGIQTSFMNNTKGDFIGIQTAFGANMATGTTIGIQTALIGNFALNDFGKIGFLDIFNIYTDPAEGIQTLSSRDPDGKRNVSGMQTALIVNCVSGTMNGIQTSLFYNTAGEMNGIETSFIKNAVRSSFSGLQLSMVENSVQGVSAGIQLSLAYNYTGSRMNGIQTSIFINQTNELIGIQTAILNMQIFNNENFISKGVQLGVVNYADALDGLQIGLINWSRRMAGVQIGLINVITSNSFPVSLLLNFSTTTNE
jgi:uncharacterized protein YbcI